MENWPVHSPLHSLPKDVMGRVSRSLLGWVLIASLAISLNACGFHLRGTLRVPESMKTTYVLGANPFQPLVVELRRALRAAGVDVVDREDDATAVLRVLRDQFERRIQAVDGGGKVLEYELRYNVRMDVVSAEGSSLIPAQEFIMVRDFFDNQTDALGRFEEENILRKEMHRSLAQLILLHLNAESEG
jgi:LPS-assembly lipoprotein